MSLIDWENMLEDPQVPFDVTFLVGRMVDSTPSLEISAHRLVLGLSSPVFLAQLHRGWGDGREGQVIRVTDVTYSAFRTMVDFMYGRPLSFSCDDTLDLELTQDLLDIVFSAHKYNLPQLETEVVALIKKNNLTTRREELVAMLELASQFSFLVEASSALRQQCEDSLNQLGSGGENEVEGDGESEQGADITTEGEVGAEGGTDGALNNDIFDIQRRLMELEIGE